MHDQHVLLTGSTGFLGMQTLLRLLERTERDVTCLVRADTDERARQRVDSVLSTLLGDGPELAAARGRVRALAADLERPGLGLEDATFDRLAGEVATVVHCAASISFGLPLAEARRVNVDGTRAVLALARAAAERGALERVVHVSTAYVAGDRARRAYEDQSDIGQTLRNTYEQTKLEAELVVEGSGLPVSILRPSIVVGERASGWTSAFNVIYWPLQAFARGLLDTVPADPDGRVDIVPVCYVADALHELACGERRSGRFHAVSGDAAPSCAKVATLAADAFGAPHPRFVAPGESPEAEERAGLFLPYFRVRCTFDTARGAALAGPAPPLDSYFDALMDYARVARWGKRGQPRWAREDPSARAA